MGPRVASKLGAATGKLFTYVDNEWVFTRKQRVNCSRASKIPLDSPEYTKAFGLAGREAYQGLIANLARQNINVLATAPWEDLGYESNGVPRYTELTEIVFAEFQLRIVYILLWPESNPDLDFENVMTHESMLEIEQIVHDRLFDRSLNDTDQRTLDLPKLRTKTYYRERAALVLDSVARFNVPLVKIFPNDAPDQVVDKVVAAFTSPTT